MNKYNEALERAKKKLEEVVLPETVSANLLYDIFPELRESEDERIRTRLIEYFQGFLKGYEDCYKDGGSVKWEGLDAKSIIAWLEKQKEASKAIEAVDRIDKYIDDHLANAHDMKDSNPDKKYYRGWDDALGKMAGILQDVYSEKENKFAPRVLPCSAAWFEDGEEKQKEHAEDLETEIDLYSEEHFEYNSEYDTLSPKGGFYFSPRTLSDIARHFYSLGRKYGGEQDGMITVSKEAWDENAKDSFERGIKVGRIRKTREQKPAEWSEEDKKDITHILKVLDDCYIYGKHDLSKTDYDNLTNTLKSLRPRLTKSDEK
jgi:hypothetical protein